MKKKKKLKMPVMTTVLNNIVNPIIENHPESRSRALRYIANKIKVENTRYLSIRVEGKENTTEALLQRICGAFEIPIELKEYDNGDVGLIFKISEFKNK